MAVELFRFESPSRRVFIMEMNASGKEFIYKILEPKIRQFVQMTFWDRATAREVMQADLILEESALSAGYKDGHSFVHNYKHETAAV